MSSGGEGGIRTRGGGFSPRTHLAGEPNRPLWHLPLAEGEGFEPTMDFSIPVFKTGALSHSAIPPIEGTRKKHTSREIPLRRTEFYHIQTRGATFELNRGNESCADDQNTLTNKGGGIFFIITIAQLFAYNS